MTYKEKKEEVLELLRSGGIRAEILGYEKPEEKMPTHLTGISALKLTYHPFPDSERFQEPARSSPFDKARRALYGVLTDTSDLAKAKPVSIQEESGAFVIKHGSLEKFSWVCFSFDMEGSTSTCLPQICLANMIRDGQITLNTTRDARKDINQVTINYGGVSKENGLKQFVENLLYQEFTKESYRLVPSGTRKRFDFVKQPDAFTINRNSLHVFKEFCEEYGVNLDMAHMMKPASRSF